MKLFKMFKRGQKGFTLVELMVVMAIMAMLATIVIPAVTGTKGPAENAQFSGDANAVQSASAKFNNDSVTQAWPEASIASVYSGDGEATLISTALGTNASAYTAVSWNGTTNIRLASGALLPVNFVPDFVPKTPASDAAIASGKHVYVWLLKAGAATNAPTRTVEVYKLTDAGTAYTKAN